MQGKKNQNKKQGRRFKLKSDTDRSLDGNTGTTDTIRMLVTMAL